MARKITNNYLILSYTFSFSHNKIRIDVYEALYYVKKKKLNYSTIRKIIILSVYIRRVLGK